MQITPYIIAVATLVPPIIEAVKTDPAFDFITEETKGRLIAISALLTAVGSIAVGLQTGTITTDSWIGLVQAGAHFAATFGLAEIMYQRIVKPVSKRLGNEE